MALAIGRVVAASSWASIALPEMAAAAADSDAVFPLLEDPPMGFQIKQTRNILKGTERWLWGNRPGIHREVTSSARGCLNELQWLTHYRNRIVHDEWYPDERVGDGDGLLGRRATRFGKEDVFSRRATFHRAAYSFYWATSCINHVTQSIQSFRDDPESTLWETNLRNGAHALTKLCSRRSSAEAGRDADWPWLERPSA